MAFTWVQPLALLSLLTMHAWPDPGWNLGSLINSTGTLSHLRDSFQLSHAEYLGGRRLL